MKKVSATQWKMKYETIQQAFLQLASGNVGAYERRRELEEELKASYVEHKKLHTHIEFLETKISEMKKKAKSKARKAKKK